MMLEQPKLSDAQEMGRLFARPSIFLPLQWHRLAGGTAMPEGALGDDYFWVGISLWPSVLRLQNEELLARGEFWVYLYLTSTLLCLCTEEEVMAFGEVSGVFSYLGAISGHQTAMSCWDEVEPTVWSISSCLSHLHLPYWCVTMKSARGFPTWIQLLVLSDGMLEFGFKT